MRKAYNIVVTVLLFIVLAASFALSGRQFFWILRIAVDGYIDALAPYFNGSFVLITYLLGVPLTFVILVVRIILTIIGEKKGLTENSAVQVSNKFVTLLEEQRIVVRDWLGKTWDKSIKEIYILGGGLTLVFFLGYYMRYRADSYIVETVEGFMACLFCGEVVALGLWLLTRRAKNLNRIVKGYEKDMIKAFNGTDGCEVFADDVLSAGNEWTYWDEEKDNLGWGKIGSRYIVQFTDAGIARVVDSTRLSRISKAMTYYYTGKGWARQRHDIYEVRFYYEKEKRKNHADVTYQFRSDANRTIFLNLLVSRLGNRIEIVQE